MIFNCQQQRLSVFLIARLRAGLGDREFERISTKVMNKSLFLLWEHSDPSSQLYKALGHGLPHAGFRIDDRLSNSHILLLDSLDHLVAVINGFTDLPDKPVKVYPYRRIL